jgi:ribosomal protein S18 acetylase RimI-like enzyme
MAEIEIGAATLDELTQIAQMDLSFESDHVWKTQMLEGMDSFESSFQRIQLPKPIRVSFQAYSSVNLETLIRQRVILSIRYDEKVIGYVRLEQDETVNRLIIKTGGVMPEYRNKGVGTVLLERICEIARQNKIRSLVCMVQAKNDPTIHFLLARGFVFCGYQEFFFRNMEIGLFFSKNIR